MNLSSTDFAEGVPINYQMEVLKCGEDATEALNRLKDAQRDALFSNGKMGEYLERCRPFPLSAALSAKCPRCGQQTGRSITVPAHSKPWIQWMCTGCDIKGYRWQVPTVTTAERILTGEHMPEHKDFAAPTFGFNDFVYRQTEASRFSHTVLPEATVLQQLADFWHARKKGYRDGVFLVPVPPDGYYTPVVKLHPGDELVGKFEGRVEGEAPRKWVAAKGKGKQPAKAVDIVVYHHDVLAENGQDCCGTAWEVISINASTTTDTDAPMHPMTLMANHFGADGGSDTLMDPVQFTQALKISYEYWADKALAEGC